jgi:hypothetical protein
LRWSRFESSIKLKIAKHLLLTLTSEMINFLFYLKKTDSNEYYDDTSDFKSNKFDYTEKVKLMEIDLKDLLFRLLEKRRSAKRLHDVDVSYLVNT